MHVVFRCDASYQIGSGHVMRCLALADALSERGSFCTFVTRSHPGNSNDRIVDHGHGLYVLDAVAAAKRQLGSEIDYASWLGQPQSIDAEQTKDIVDQICPDMIIVDHYALDYLWHRKVGSDRSLMVIDDLANRRYECDLLLDQNFGRAVTDYDGLVAGGTKCLMGPTFALLRPEFKANRPKSLARRREIAKPMKLLISMGGTDIDNSSGRILTVLSNSPIRDELDVTVVLGHSAPNKDAVRDLIARSPIDAKLLSGVAEMAALFVDMDLAIGAAGGSVWERCCLGVPSLLLSIADNQKAAALALGNSGIAIDLGDLRVAGWENRLLETLEDLLRSDKLARLSTSAADLVDGRGSARVASHIISRLVHVREAKISDAKVVWEWRHAGGATQFYKSDSVVPYQEHLEWFSDALGDTQRLMLIIEFEGSAAAHIRFDLNGKARRTATISISIAPELRGRGLAQAFLIAGMDFAASKGFREICALVHRQNIASFKLFGSCGFREGERDGKFVKLYKALGEHQPNVTGAIG